jgi:hypothetical protein
VTSTGMGCQSLAAFLRVEADGSTWQAQALGIWARAALQRLQGPPADFLAGDGCSLPPMAVRAGRLGEADLGGTGKRGARASGCGKRRIPVESR